MQDKTLLEGLGSKDLQFISKGTESWFKYSKENGQEFGLFGIFSDYEIPKSYLLNQLEYLLIEDWYGNTEEEKAELKVIIERVKNGTK